MAVRLVNPFWKSAAQQKAEQHAAAVQAWLQANATNRLVTMAEIKAALPAVAPDMNRTVFNQICAQIGIEIDNPDDTEA